MQTQTESYTLVILNGRTTGKLDIQASDRSNTNVNDWIGCKWVGCEVCEVMEAETGYTVCRDCWPQAQVEDWDTQYYHWQSETNYDGMYEDDFDDEEVWGYGTTVWGELIDGPNCPIIRCSVCHEPTHGETSMCDPCGIEIYGGELEPPF